MKTAAQESFAGFSPDGKWISYQSDESGKDQVYVQPFPPGAGASGKWQISVDGGVGARWRGDGKELFYLAGSKLMAVAISAVGGGFHAGIPKELFETRMSSRLFYWQIGRPGALQNLVHVECEASVPVHDVIRVGHEPPGLYSFSAVVH